MKLKSRYPAVLICLFAILLFCSACPRKPERQNLASNLGPPILLPKGVKNAESDSTAASESAVLVSVAVEGIYYVGAEPYPVDEVGEKVSRQLVGQTADNKIVFFAGSYSLDYGVVIKLLDELRKTGVVKIGLLVDQPGSKGRNSFKVQIPAEPSPNDDLSKLKPNPLTLVASMSKDLKLRLNQDPIGEFADLSPLTQKLGAIFQQRKALHAYQPGMETRTDVPEDERLEKTVVIKATRSTRYVDVIHLIDAVRGAGANPIVLQIDDLSD